MSGGSYSMIAKKQLSGIVLTGSVRHDPNMTHRN